MLQVELQNEMNRKNQKITELNQTVFISLQEAFASLKQIADLRGENEAMEGVAQEINIKTPEPTSPEPCNAEQNTQIEEQSEHSEPEPEQELSEKSTDAVVEETADAVNEYKDEEEYAIMKKRDGMLQPLETLVSGEFSSRIALLGCKTLKGASYRFHDRITNAEATGGPTLVTTQSPYVYIPNKNISAATTREAFLMAVKDITDIAPYQDNDKIAKRLVGAAMRNSGISTKEALEYVEGICQIPATLTKGALKHITAYHINWGGKFGKMLQKTKKSITQKKFLSLANACGHDSALLLLENKIDEFGWLKVLGVLKAECQAAVCSGTPARSKKMIVMKDDKGNVVAEYKTAHDASIATGICRSSIAKNLKGTYSGYKKLKSKDGKFYTFEYQETSKTAVKSSARQYNRNKIVIVDKESGVATTYSTTKEAASALGVKSYQIDYRAKAANHLIGGSVEVWYEKDYTPNVGVAA